MINFILSVCLVSLYSFFFVLTKHPILFALFDILTYTPCLKNKHKNNKSGSHIKKNCIWIIKNLLSIYFFSNNLIAIFFPFFLCILEVVLSTAYKK